jgi:hypothetical protein
MALPIEELVNGCHGAARRANIGMVFVGFTSISAVLLGKAHPAIEQNTQRVNNICQYAIISLVGWRALCSVMK